MKNFPGIPGPTTRPSTQQSKRPFMIVDGFLSFMMTPLVKREKVSTQYSIYPLFDGPFKSIETYSLKLFDTGRATFGLGGLFLYLNFQILQLFVTSSTALKVSLSFSVLFL